MIKSIEIKNFKCFDNLRLPLSKLTILAGANASGKSTIMQALLPGGGRTSASHNDRIWNQLYFIYCHGRIVVRFPKKCVLVNRKSRGAFTSGSTEQDGEILGMFG